MAKKKSWLADYISMVEHQRIVDEMREQPLREAAARQLADSIMLILSQKPRTEWPREAQIAFDYEAQRNPLLRRMFP